MARPVDVGGFREAIAELHEGSLDGANVTMPHKQLAYELCDVPSPLAERAGAVNTLTRMAGEIMGDNTDILGIRSAWQWAGLPDAAPVLILGAGGAAAAAALALEGRRLYVQARSEERAEALIAQTGVGAEVLPWGSRVAGAVLVNATPVGMQGEHLPGDLLESCDGLFDMAYGDSATPAVRHMRLRRAPVAEGLDMLIGQAVASFRIWTRTQIDPAVMRAAALDELLRRREATTK